MSECKIDRIIAGLVLSIEDALADESGDPIAEYHLRRWLDRRHWGRDTCNEALHMTPPWELPPLDGFICQSATGLGCDYIVRGSLTPCPGECEGDFPFAQADRNSIFINMPDCMTRDDIERGEHHRLVRTEWKGQFSDNIYFRWVLRDPEPYVRPSHARLRTSASMWDGGPIPFYDGKPWRERPVFSVLVRATVGNGGQHDE